jgi:hypothetical protein
MGDLGPEPGPASIEKRIAFCRGHVEIAEKALAWWRERLSEAEDELALKQPEINQV